MKIVTLDVSSTTVGFAVLTSGKLEKCGLIKPFRTKDDANTRIRHMTKLAMEICDAEMPDKVIIEDNSGKVARYHGGGGAGLAVLGKAIGYMAAAMEAVKWEVELLLENEWTRGVPKKQRQVIVALQHRDKYDKDHDPGGDASDAIRMGEFWFEKMRCTPGGAR